MARYTEEDVTNQIAVVSELVEVRTHELTRDPPPTHSASGRALRASNLSPISSVIVQRLRGTIEQREHDARIAALIRQQAIVDIERRLRQAARSQAERDRKRKREVAEAKDEFATETHGRRSPHVRLARSAFHSPEIAAAATLPDDEPGAPPSQYAPPNVDARSRERIEKAVRNLNRQLAAGCRVATVKDYHTWFNLVKITINRDRPHFDQPATRIQRFVTHLDSHGSGLSADDSRKITALLHSLYDAAAKPESAADAVHKWHICFHFCCPLWWPVLNPRIFCLTPLENVFSQQRRLFLSHLKRIDPELGPYRT